MVIINRLVNLFKKNKEWEEAWKYKKFGVRKDEIDGKDYIWESRNPIMDVKYDYYRDREKVEN